MTSSKNTLALFRRRILAVDVYKRRSFNRQLHECAKRNVYMSFLETYRI